MTTCLLCLIMTYISIHTIVPCHIKCHHIRSPISRCTSCNPNTVRSVRPKFLFFFLICNTQPSCRITVNKSDAHGLRCNILINAKLPIEQYWMIILTRHRSTNTQHRLTRGQHRPTLGQHRPTRRHHRPT